MFWILLTGLLAVLIWYHFVKPLSHWKNMGVKQSNPWIFFGDSWLTLFRRISITEFVEKMYSMFPYCRYSGFYQFNIPTLIIKDLELIKQITVRDFDYFTDHKFFIDPEADPLWGGNIFALEGKKWREMRATLSRIFTSSKIKSMFVLMEDTAETFVQYFLNKNQDIIEVDLKKTLTRYTNDVIATTAFGIKVDSLNDPQNIFYEMGKDIINFSGILTNIKIMANLVVPKLMRMLNIGVFSKKVTTYFTTIINETIQIREEKGIVRPDLINLLIETRNSVSQDESETVDPNIKETSDIGKYIEFLFSYFNKLLIKEILNEKQRYEDKKPPLEVYFIGYFTDHKGNFKQHRKITNSEIASQAFVFFIGGFDTIATAMCCGCHELAFNVNVQDRLRKEIKKTYEENNEKLTYDVLMQMKYMDMVVSEILRKWPPGIFLDRVCTKPYTIEPVEQNESPVHLKVGDVIWIPVRGIHRDPAYFKNPDTYDPERFSDENQNSINPYYMPFGVGPRNCIGSRFALVEIKVLLFNLLLNFEIVPTNKTNKTINLSRKSLIPTAENFWFGLKRINK